MSRRPKSPLIEIVTALSLAVAMTGCANPAADAPAAEVGEVDGTNGASTADAEGVHYALTDDSVVHWTASKVTRSHDGTFPDVEGTIALVDGTPEASSVEVLIDTTTLTSDTDQLTTHLKSADFFDVERYPEASFRSTSISPQNDGTYQVEGMLEMHGVTRQIRFPATIEVANGSIRTQAEFSINRFDWEIDYKGAADDLIRDEVLLRFDLRAEAAGEGAPPIGDEAAATTL